MQCDFCGSAEVTWTYTTKRFLFEITPGTILRSRDAWRACDGCKPHIEAANFEPILNTVEARRKEEGLETSPDARANVKNYMEEFALHRQGEAIRLEPRPSDVEPFWFRGNETVN